MKNFFFLLFLSRKKKSKKETNNSIALAHILTLSFSRTGDRRIVFLASFFFVFESYGNLSIHQYFFFFFFICISVYSTESRSAWRTLLFIYTHFYFTKLNFRSSLQRPPVVASYPSPLIPNTLVFSFFLFLLLLFICFDKSVL